MGSKSSSSQSSTTNQYDQRVAGAEGSVTLGTNAEFTINQEFPEDVATFASDVVDVLKKTQDISKSSVTSSLKALETVAKREQSTGLFLQDITDKILPISAVVIAGLLGLAYIKRGKK